MIKDLVEELYPLHRTLVSDDTDKALEIIGREFPKSMDYRIDNYPPGSDAWTWKIPERYRVNSAYIEVNGKRIIDFADNPLHLVSYSLPINKTISWNELVLHLHYSEQRPNAIPWEFKYYQRDWGFCLSKNQYDALPRMEQYHVVIDSEFDSTPIRGLKTGIGQLGNGEILLCAHICHPYQCNDDLVGVAVAVEIAKRLDKKPLTENNNGVRWLFCPETIGSIAYFSNHEDEIDNIKYGIFIEMVGTLDELVLQHSLQRNSQVDAVMEYVLDRKVKYWRRGNFREVIVNDEMVINGPGVNIPCVSLSRWPYEEYHTSDDNPSIIKEHKLKEAADVVEETVRILASNYKPKRTFKGPIFLSRYNLWVNWRVDPELNKAMDIIMFNLEGDKTIFEISQIAKLEYWKTWNYIEEFRKNGLVE